MEKYYGEMRENMSCKNENEQYYVLPDVEVFKATVIDEFDTYYNNYDLYTQPLLDALRQMVQENEGASSFEIKAKICEILAKECPVHVFRHCPFFFEISSGRERRTWGGLQSPVGTFQYHMNARKWDGPYNAAIREYSEAGLFFGGSPVSIDHHCAGYDRLLSEGILGIIAKAKEQLETCDDPHKTEFYNCVIRTNTSLLDLAARFAAEARRLEQEADSEEEAKHYRKIAEAAIKVPAHPAETFYEALCTILFYRECVGSLEGIGISTFGHLDRLLYPLYEADLAAGRITHDEALTLICWLLMCTEVRAEAHRGAGSMSTTIVIGGCDTEGNVIYNPVTDMVLDAVMNMRSTGTKINCRISKNHPEAYLKKIAQVQLEKIPTIMMHNDDVLIPARVRYGQAEEDARLYVGAGCHEILLANTEVCVHADSWINLPGLLLRTLSSENEDISYDALYNRFIRDVKDFHDRIAEARKDGEAHWFEYSPMPLLSGSITGCLEQGMDITEGGAKYNTTMLSMLGTATLIDSLYAVKKLVFEDQRLTLKEYLRILAEDFRNDEPFRQYILNKLPKHGTNDPEVNQFAGKVLEDLSTVSGQTNGRGGKFMPSFYPHYLFHDMGMLTGATPDGRHAGTDLSRGVSASEFIETESVLNLILSMRDIDFTRYAESFCTEITLPLLENDSTGSQVLLGIIQTFLDVEGSSLQMNLLDRELLLEAQKDPENHRNVTVRVCGYSAAFVWLEEDKQEEIMKRMIR